MQETVQDFNENITDYILSEEDAAKLTKRKKPKRRKGKNTRPAKYRVVLQDGCDFIIEKRKNSTRQLLVVLVSQMQYYLQNQTGKREVLNNTRLWNFIKEADEIIYLDDVTWITGLNNDNLLVSEIMSNIKNPEVVGLMRKNCFFIYNESIIKAKNYIEETEKLHDEEEAWEEVWNENPFDVDPFAGEPFHRNNFNGDPFANYQPEDGLNGFGSDDPFGSEPVNNIWAYEHEGPVCDLLSPLIYENGRFIFGDDLILESFDNIYSVSKIKEKCDSKPGIVITRNSDCGGSSYWHIYDYRNCILYNQSNILKSCNKVSPTMYEWMIDYMSKRRSVSRKELFEKYLFDQDTREYKILMGYFSFMALSGFFGEEWGREAVKKYLDCGMRDIIMPDYLCSLFTKLSYKVKCNTAEYYKRMPVKRKFKAESFINYLFKAPLNQGFSDDLNSFLFIWNEVLSLQEEIYGKIRDKYPDNIASLYIKLSYYWRNHADDIIKEKWKRAIKPLEKYEYSNDTYFVRCPQSPAELMKEGNCQNNCVSSYQDRILEGRTGIFLMRKNDAPEESLVTIELDKDGMVVQAKRKYNELITEEDEAFINEWAKEKCLKLAYRF